MNYFAQNMTCSKLSVSYARFYNMQYANCFKPTPFFTDGSTFLGITFVIVVHKILVILLMLILQMQTSTIETTSVAKASVCDISSNQVIHTACTCRCNHDFCLLSGSTL